jgi:REP element-mobilizing transposase RayT
MTTARSDIVVDGVEGLYHCVARCVRRAFLCGLDAYSGRSFEHRREWIRSRLKELAGSFAIEIIVYSVLSNHLHVVLRTRPDLMDELSGEEVARRWLAIFPRVRDENGLAVTMDKIGIRQITSDPDRLGQIRLRLQSVSWFMRCLNENIARRANKEDNCKGRFWEGRFKCQALLDEAALLTCMAYVDLNPIRAGLADTPEDSDFTSVQERIVNLREEQSAEKSDGMIKPDSESNTLEQLDESRENHLAEMWLHPFREGITAGHDSILSLTVEEYLDLLDWTGRQIVEGKKGAIPEHLAPILTRLNIANDRWLDTVQGFGGFFYRVVGQFENIMAAAGKASQRWLKGQKSSKLCFSAS